MAIVKGRRVYYWPEQDLLNSGHWRVDGGNLTFQSGDPHKYVDCSVTAGTRTQGNIPWKRSSKNDNRARRFHSDQPRIHFMANGQVSPLVKMRPERLEYFWAFAIFEGWAMADFSSCGSIARDLTNYDHGRWESRAWKLGINYHGIFATHRFEAMLSSA